MGGGGGTSKLSGTKVPCHIGCDGSSLAVAAERPHEVLDLGISVKPASQVSSGSGFMYRYLFIVAIMRHARAWLVHAYIPT